MIRISPFDDYYLFTLYDEVDGEDTPIDLSNVGDIFLNFIGDTDDIDIKNHTQVAEVDLSQGEVLFRITRSDSKKVLALDNNNFYISTKMVDPTDGSISDESILYQGVWLAVDDANRTTLTSQIEEQRMEYTLELARLKDELDKCNKEKAELLTAAEEDDLTIQALQNSNEELTNEIADLKNDLNATKLAELNRRAKEAQARAKKQMKIKQQIISIRKRAEVAQTKSKKKSFFKQAAKNLQNFTTGKNPVTNSSTIKDDFLRNRNYE